MPTVAQILSTREPTGAPVRAATGYVLELTTRDTVGEAQWGTVTLEGTDGATARCLVPESLIVTVDDRVLMLLSNTGNFIIVRLSDPSLATQEEPSS